MELLHLSRKLVGTLLLILLVGVADILRRGVYA